MRKKLCGLLALALLLIVSLTACGEIEAWKEGKLMGINLSSETRVFLSDSHGGFHGDGISYRVYDLTSSGVQEEIEKNPDWHPLPAPSTIQALAYGWENGSCSQGPYLVDDQGNCLLPKIEKGYYFFFDRHREGTNPQDPSQVLARYSLNFSLAFYDSDTYRLYYLEMDT